MNIKALILAGGSGTRLWPLSRQTFPKQLLSLCGNRTLIQDTCKRISSIIPYDDQWIITGKDHAPQIKIQLDEMKIAVREGTNDKGVEILVESEAKNTAPAILWAAYRCKFLYGDDCLLAVFPADHMITNTAVFEENLIKSLKMARRDGLVTFGINPSSPETGYGYIKTKKSETDIEGISKVECFVEKPELALAERFLNEGGYFWNSGMFVFHTKTLINEAGKYCKDLVDLFERIDVFNDSEVAEVFSKARSISIDYAIMQQTEKAYVVESEFGWSDVGSWKSLFELSPKNEEGNVIDGQHITLDTYDSFVYGKERLIVTIGLKDLAIIDTKDAILISPLNLSHRISEAIKILKDKNSKKIIEHKTVRRHWGEYTVIEEGPGYKIKKIVVQQGKKLSRQVHCHRSEHWIVVQGTARVTKGNEVFMLSENESTYIPKNMIHRLENPGLIPLEIIEAQCGNYLEEDDIVRLEEVNKLIV